MAEKVMSDAVVSVADKVELLLKKYGLMATDILERANNWPQIMKENCFEISFLESKQFNFVLKFLY